MSGSPHGWDIVRVIGIVLFVFPMVFAYVAITLFFAVVSAISWIFKAMDTYYDCADSPKADT